MLTLLLCALMVLPSLAVGAEIDEQKVKKIKAAYLLNFLKFAEWSEGVFEDEDSPIVIGIVGEDPIGPILDRTMQSERVSGRGITIRRISIESDDRESEDSYTSEAQKRLRAALAECHLVYVSQTELNYVPQLHDELVPSWALTVGDARALAKAGTMLAVGVRQDRVVFYANREALERASLRVSSKVLRLAKLLD